MSAQRQRERLAALAAFVPVFGAADFSFGEWHSPPGQMPWFSLSADASRFISTVSMFDWVVPGFDWPTWQRTDEARRFLEDADAIAGATVEDLERLLTVHIRLNRFSEGHLAVAFEAGQFTAIAQRAAALLRDGEESTGQAEPTS